MEAFLSTNFYHTKFNKLLNWRFSLGIFMLFCQQIALAQTTDLYSATHKKDLKKFASETRAKEENAYKAALDWAKKHNWDIKKTYSDGKIAHLLGMDEFKNPVYAATESNAQSAASVRTNSLYAGGSLGVSLSGGSSRMNGKLAIWDGGSILGTHQEFIDRVIQSDDATSLSVHSNHVAGTMMATGINPIAKGMAFGAKLKAFDFSNDYLEMTAAAPDLLLSNHSYGELAGWVFNDTRTTTNKWEWWGTDAVSKTEDYKFGFYESRCRDWDKLSWNAPYYLIVKSAGNKRSETGPAAGTVYYLRTSSDTSTVARSRNNGYDIIPSYGGAKNILSVAAVNPIANGDVTNPAQVQISNFSSWGPTDDGRIKPDISAIGVNIFSVSSDSPTAYTVLSGTSMSSPNVTGSLFLLQELYANLNDGQFMRSASLKGLALHTATDVGNAGPDYIYGWGLLNIEKAGQVLQNKDKNHLFVEKNMAQGGVFKQDVVASGKGPLVVTISWTDPEGEASSAIASNLNNRTPKLVNDLDVKVSDGKSDFLAWVLDPVNPAQLATKGNNIRDNVEQVYIANPVPGKTYSIEIKHKGTLTLRTPNADAQPYTLAVSGIGGTAYCTSAPTKNADTRIEKVIFGSINNTNPVGCTTFSDFTNLSINISKNDILPLEVSVGTCGVQAKKIVKAFIDWNADGDFADANELVATSAVIDGSDTFKAKITAPTTLTTGVFSRLRIVCAETTAPETVNACGEYSQGETQDYLILFATAPNDIAITALSPEDGFCEGVHSVSVRLKNAGQQTQSNIGVSVKVMDESNAIIATLAGTYTASLIAADYDDYAPAGTFTAEAGKKYSFIAKASIASADQDTTNNTFRTTRPASVVLAKPVASALLCGENTVLKATSDGLPFWYNASNNLVATGTAALIAKQPIGTTYSVVANVMNATIGAANKKVFPTGGYNQFSPSVKIKTYVPLVIESARLYIGNSGKIQFTLENENGQEFANTILDVKATRNPAVKGVALDDPTDIGAIYQLNLPIPVPGEYLISIAYDTTATIFRNKDNITGYPFSVSNVMDITGTTASAPSDPLQFYYYFYDMKLRALGCAGQTASVTVQQGKSITASVSPASTTICGDNAAATLSVTTGANYSYQWLLDDKAITGAINPTITVTKAGKYTVKVAEKDGCETISTAGQVIKSSPIAPSITRNGFTLICGVATSYQWYKDGVAIAGATNASYAAGAGAYKVLCVVNGCEVFTDVVIILVTSTEPQKAISKAELRVFPNPAVNDKLTIEFESPTQTAQNIQIQIYDATGKAIQSQRLERINGIYRSESSASTFATGTYMISVQEKDEVLVKKFVKE